jgi:hypothetical protein
MVGKQLISEIVGDVFPFFHIVKGFCSNPPLLIANERNHLP